MASREMREAKKQAGLCLHEGCGSQAITPVFQHCQKHLGEDQRLLVRRGPRKKRPTRN
jgi:hypothetical protein